MQGKIIILLSISTVAIGLRLPLSLDSKPVADSGFEKLDPDGRKSYNIEEWNAFINAHVVETKNALEKTKVLSRTTDNFCEGDKALPKVFLLGPQKAGSTTMSADLFISGLPSIIDDKKEVHVFDEVCRWGAKDCNETVQSWKDLSKFSQFKPCQGASQFADMTPLNLRMSGLPKKLKQLYGEEKSKQLKFIILLRDPIQRLVSGLNWPPHHHEYRTLGFGSVNEFVDELSQKYEEVKKAGLAQSGLADQFYRSMYGAQLDSWLRHFSGDQFVLVPTAKYFKDATVRTEYLKEIAQHFQLQLSPENVNNASTLNKHHHNPCGKCVDNEFLKGEFQKDVESLAARIAKDGVKLVGYHDVLDEKTIIDFVKSNW